jgi:hypothetical protein
MSPRGPLPSTVADNEILARFIDHRSDVRADQTIRPKARPVANKREFVGGSCQFQRQHTARPKSVANFGFVTVRFRASLYEGEFRFSRPVQ